MRARSSSAWPPYATYTVAITFRVCFTFGLLTTIYNWCARAPGVLPKL